LLQYLLSLFWKKKIVKVKKICAKLLQNDRIPKVLTSELKSAQLINKILSEELKQIVDEHKNTENLPTGEKLISQTKNYAESESEASDRNCKNPKEP
jgi:hypothetical protein